MQRLFSSNFQADSPESVKKIKQLANAPIEVKMGE